MPQTLIAVAAVLVLGAAAAPVEQASQAANSINASRRFYCPKRVQAFCSASNIHSGCTFNGVFRSDAMDTCGACTCESSPSGLLLGAFVEA